MRTPGDLIDQGLSAKAASELGLLKGTAVGTSLIDAHAGGLGMIGCSVPGSSPNVQTRLGKICVHCTVVTHIPCFNYTMFYSIYSFNLWNFNLSYDSK